MPEMQVRPVQQTPTVEGVPSHRADPLAARLAALDLPQGQATGPARRDALDRLRAMSLPRPRDEYWRYTDPAPFNAPAPASPPVRIAPSAAPDGRISRP